MAISCTPSDLMEQAKCFVGIPGGTGNILSGSVGAVIIYGAVAYANGGEAPQVGFALGNPDEGWSFGDPGTGDEFGSPI
jgi:hypothetical protein